MRHVRLTVITAVVPLLIASVGCGGDDEPEAAADPQRYIDAKLELLPESGLYEKDEVVCVVTAVVDAVGVDRLEEAGVDPVEFAEAVSLADLDIELTEQALDELGDTLGGCDLGATFAEGLDGSRGGRLSDDDLGCIAANIDDDALGAAIAHNEVYGGGLDFDMVLLGAVVACPDVFTELIVNGFEDATGTELPAECVESLAGLVESDPDAAVDFFEGDSRLWKQFRVACPEAIGPFGGTDDPQ